MADFYTYRNEFSRRRRKRRLVLVLLVLLALICAVAGWFWQRHDDSAQAEPAQTPAVATPAATQSAATQEVAATPQPTPATGKTPTKITGFKGNSDLLKVLLNAMAGKYNP